MKHISKKEFLAHGWRKGDRVRVTVDGKTSLWYVHALALSGGALTLINCRDKEKSVVIFDIKRILEIIPVIQPKRRKK